MCTLDRNKRVLGKVEKSKLKGNYLAIVKLIVVVSNNEVHLSVPGSAYEPSMSSDNNYM